MGLVKVENEVLTNSGIYAGNELTNLGIYFREEK